jgi:D-arabinitol dehydrogenase (NADP+)
VCGTDGHIHDGEFIAKFPVRTKHPALTSLISLLYQLIPGHEAVGVAVEIGKGVKNFKVGDRCVADVGSNASFRRDIRS